MGERTLTWKITEMSDEMREDVEKQVNAVLDSQKNEISEQEVSQHIKDFFDRKYSPNWHCIVGKHFASQVTYTTKHYIFFYVG